MSEIKILVTGASGFIGRHLVLRLRRSGYDVTGLDLSSGGYGGGAHVRCDVRSGGDLAKAIAELRPGALVHLAARTDLDGRSLEDYSANTEGVRNLIRAVREVPWVRRVLYASSQLVCRVGYVPRDDTDFAPDSLYGESKVLGERIVRENDGGGVTWAIVRPTTVWGPGMSPHYQQFLRLVQRGAYRHPSGRKLEKSYGYVENVTHQIARLLEAPAEQIHRRVFYLADYELLSIREWADAFRAEFGGKPLRSVPVGLLAAAARAGDLAGRLARRRMPLNSFVLGNLLGEYRFDLDATRRLCGPLPVSMKEGVRRTAAWMASGDRSPGTDLAFVPDEGSPVPGSEAACDG